jgi:hypothetical protein
MSETPFDEYTVIALRKQQLWAEGAHGDILRAWRPQQAGVRHGAQVRVYSDESSEVSGWHDPESGQAVDQRRIDHAGGGEPRLLACLGACGIVWMTPADEALLASESACLHCGGPRREI